MEAIVGTFAHGLVLDVSTKVQFKWLCYVGGKAVPVWYRPKSISRIPKYLSRLPNSPHIWGGTSVCIASLCNVAVMGSEQQIKNVIGYITFVFYVLSADDIHERCWFEWSGGFLKPSYDKAFAFVVGITISRCSGPFKTVGPTSLIHSGYFAVKSLKATAKDSTKKQRALIQDLGKSHGCHMCGRGSLFHKFLHGQTEKNTFICDHIPPRSVVKRMSQKERKKVKYEFFPHCKDCSTKQAVVCRHHLSDFPKTLREHEFGSRPGYYGVGALQNGIMMYFFPKERVDP